MKKITCLLIVTCMLVTVFSGAIPATVLADVKNAESEEQPHDNTMELASVQAKSRGSLLTGNNQKIYNYLRAEIEKVAAGKINSTVFNVSLDLLGVEGVSYSAEDLRVSSLVKDGEITQEAVDAIVDSLGIDFNKIMLSLMADCPYELYWYDKAGGVFSGKQTVNVFKDGQEWKIGFSNGLTYSFSVAAGYSAGEFTVGNSARERVQHAVGKAKDIVEKYRNVSDYDKLNGYRVEICNLVSYDSATANDAATPYGDPWQIISVFDEDETTNVVCEGYAKAFKYLCDLTEFSGDISCITVSGTMRGGTGEGSHMWNIVSMEDGKNYLADLTNCDEDTINAPEKLFLAGYTDKAGSNGYIIHFDENNLIYVYDNDSLSIYTPEELSICASDLTEAEPSDQTADEGTDQNDTIPLDRPKETAEEKTQTEEPATQPEAPQSTDESKEKEVPAPDSSQTVSGIQFSDVTAETVVPTSLKAISWAVGNGIVKGYSDNTFKPEAICTREQFTIMLWRFAGEPASDASAVNRFTDVSEFSNNTSKKAVAWAVEQGVIKGFSDGSFQPKEDITRAQVAVMLWRFAGEVSVSTTSSKFSDISSYSSSVQNAIIWEESAGVASGYKDGTFKPDDGCQRQHMAIFLYRFNSKVVQYKPLR